MGIFEDEVARAQARVDQKQDSVQQYAQDYQQRKADARKLALPLIPDVKSAIEALRVMGEPIEGNPYGPVSNLNRSDRLGREVFAGWKVSCGPGGAHPVSAGCTVPLIGTAAIQVAGNRAMTVEDIAEQGVLIGKSDEATPEVAVSDVFRRLISNIATALVETRSEAALKSQTATSVGPPKQPAERHQQKINAIQSKIDALDAQVAEIRAKGAKRGEGLFEYVRIQRRQKIERLEHKKKLLQADIEKETRRRGY